MDETLTSVWEEQRPRLINVAYRMLGSRADAEDVVQDVYLRLQSADQAEIRDPVGWLLTVTGRLCIDQLRSARRRRETYVGPWLPEPIVHGLSDPVDRITLDDSVRMALLIVLEQLTPAERASYILHDVFQVSFDQVGEIVGRSPAACRQLASRARQRIAASVPPRFVIDPMIAADLASRFATACRTGNYEMLVDLLDAGAQGLFDSAGRMPGAPTELVVGAGNVARRLTAVFAGTEVRFVPTLINGDHGLLVVTADGLVSLIAFEFQDDRISRVHGVGNPDKLTGIPSQEFEAT